MKIKQKHYDYLVKAMQLAGVNAEWIRLRREFVSGCPNVKDVEKRVRWDALYQASVSYWICYQVYAYADDSHLDTALRRIVAAM